MSMPGWYPDPAGAPGRFRYWDGSAWSQETTADPAQGSPSGPGTPGAPQEPEHRRGLGWLVALAAVLALALLVWAVFLRPSGGSTAKEDHNTSSPTGPVWNEKDTPTPTPSGSSPAPSNGAQVKCPETGGNILPSDGSTLTSAGLVVDRITGWDFPPSYATRSLHDVQMQELLVYQGMKAGWLSGQLVGHVDASDGFTDVKTSAQQVMSCFATSSWYENFTGREDLSSESMTVSGHKGWRIRSNVHVSSPDLPNISGDRLDIIVVDTGHAGQLGVYAGWATIDDTDREKLVDQAITTLRVA